MASASGSKGTQKETSFTEATETTPVSNGKHELNSKVAYLIYGDKCLLHVYAEQTGNSMFSRKESGWGKHGMRSCLQRIVFRVYL